ncbi:MAG: Gfo/Idh/MocA family oxidoreductase [Bacteroidales bacterium]|nr:Gfo/Idh/MocA family oxidoreductase [Bacteroidales bacterium]
MSKEMSRRTFLKTGAVATAALAAAPDTVFGKSSKKKVAPSDKINILGVGIGGRGSSDLNHLSSQNIIGLCDVDWKYAAPVFERYPQAKRYKDFRVMFDEMLKDADAVMVATADHTHAIVAANAIAAGKHVYCEKPLTHTVYESRLLAKLAAKYKVATQMGNQGASGKETARAIEWIQNGEIGEVRKVESFTDRPIWPQGLNVPTAVDPIPDTLDWDLFIGPAKYRPFNNIYHPWNFRGWWDFGTGALGDMACHILHAPFAALKLTSPIKVQGSSTALLTDCAPTAQIVKMTFPARENLPKVAMPEVDVWWYDGGLLPERPEDMEIGKDLLQSGGGSIFHGTKDTLVVGCYGVEPYLLSGRVPASPKADAQTIDIDDHQMDWVRACKEDASVRVPSKSDFSIAGPLNEMVVMGVLAVRLQSLNQVLHWDGKNMKFTNIPEGATIRTMKEDSFSVSEGHPTFNKVYTDPVDANAYAQELIKHTYRDGWSLPEMPE